MATAARAETVELLSFQYETDWLACKPGDHYVVTSATSGTAARFPTSLFVIRGYSLYMRSDDSDAYLFVGETPPNGDAIAGKLHGSQHETRFYPYPLGFALDPKVAELHWHYGCSSTVGSGRMYFGGQIFYTQ